MNRSGKFTYTETPGEDPNLHSWLAGKLKEHAKTRFGLNLTVVVRPLEEMETEDDGHTSDSAGGS